MDCRDDRSGQALDAVEDLGARLDRLDDLLFGFEGVELSDVGAGDEVALLAGHQNEAANLAFPGGRLDRQDDRGELLERAPTERIHGLALAIEDGPGDLLDINLVSPILEVRDIGWRGGCHSAATLSTSSSLRWGTMSAGSK